MNENEVATQVQTEVSDPLKMLDTSTSSGSGQHKTEKKDDVRVSEAMSHVHDHRNLITKKDLVNLKRNKYDKVRESYPDSFVVKNNKTGQIVEIRAASSFHACNMIGWRPKNCTLIDIIKGEEKVPVVENNTVMAGTNETEKQTQNIPTAADGVNELKAGDGEVTV